LNIYAAEKLKFRWSEPAKFDYLTMSNDGNVEFCNTMPYYVNFKNFQVTILYDSQDRGTFRADSLNIGPFVSIMQKGVFSAEDYSAAKQLFMQMDFQIDGGEISIDPNKMVVIEKIETPIIGVIPYSTTIQYSGLDFDKIMRSNDWNC
jgi:hypothetical protein